MMRMSQLLSPPKTHNKTKSKLKIRREDFFTVQEEVEVSEGPIEVEDITTNRENTEAEALDIQAGLGEVSKTRREAIIRYILGLEEAKKETLAHPNRVSSTGVPGGLTNRRFREMQMKIEINSQLIC